MKHHIILSVVTTLFSIVAGLTQLGSCNAVSIGDSSNPLGSNFSSDAGTIVVIVPEDYPIEAAYADFNGIRLTTDRIATQVPGFDPSLLIGDPMIATSAGIKYYAIFADQETVTLDINGAPINAPTESAQELLAMAANAGMFPVEGAAALSAALDFVEGTGWAFNFAIVYPGFDPAVDELPWVAAQAAQAAAQQQTAAQQPTPIATLSPLASQLVAASQPATPIVPAPWDGLDITGDPFSPLDYESAGQAARRLGTQGYSTRCLGLYFEAVVEWDYEDNGDGSPKRWDYWRTDVQVPLPALCQN